MGTLRLRLLVAPALEDAGLSWPLPAGAVGVLLAYLACRGRRVRRDEVAVMFWPEASQHTARTNLRQLLARTRHWLYGHAPGAPTLQVDGAYLNWQVSTDVHELEAAHAACVWPVLFGLRGCFLEGFSGTAGVEEWLASERERLADLWRSGMLRWSRELAEQGAPDRALDVLDGLLRQDPLDEGVVHEALVLAARRPDRQVRERARSVYEAFARQLDRELGGAPDVALRELAGSLLSPGVHLDAGRRVQMPGPPGAAHPMVGRQAQLEQLRCLLSSESRLVSLVAPGGTGKSRLALAAAHALVGEFRDGVAFVELDAVHSDHNVVPTFARALQLVLARPDAETLVQALRDRGVLIVVDNAEHLSALPGLIRQLLRGCPDVRLLVTSRVPLDVRGETVVPLEGLPVPAAGGDARPGDALELFRACIERADASYVVQGDELSALVEIARRVDGMPLAIELAAGWVPLLGAAAVLRELDAGLGILSEPGAERGRHHSVDRVLQQAWALLTPDMREVLERTSVFRAPFAPRVAVDVCGAALATLHDLRARGLIRSRQGRLTLHPVVARYAHQQLEGRPAAAREARERHAAHHLAGLAGWLRFVRGGEGQLAALDAIEEHLEDHRAAWNWALREGREDLLARTLPWWWHYFECRGRYAEGAELYGEAAGALQDLRVRGTALTCLAILLGRQDELEASERCTARSVALLQDGDAQDLLLTRLHQGVLLALRGNWAAAGAVNRALLADARRLGDDWTARGSLANLALCEHQLERPRRALVLLRACAALNRGALDAWACALSATMLGDLHLGLGEYSAAHLCYLDAQEAWASLRAQRQLGDAHRRLGDLAFIQGDCARAAAFYTGAVEHLEAAGDRTGLLQARLRLGHAALATGGVSEAHALLDSALREGALRVVHDDVWLLTGTILLWEGRTGAQEVFDRIGQHTPFTTAVMEARGQWKQALNGVRSGRRSKGGAGARPEA